MFSKGFWEGEWRNRKKNGEVFLTRCRISELRLEDRRYIVSVQIDITEEKKIQEALNETQKELRLTNEELEQKVIQRTAELKMANIQLKSANEQLDWRAKPAATLSLSRQHPGYMRHG